MGIGMLHDDDESTKAIVRKIFDAQTELRNELKQHSDEQRSYRSEHEKEHRNHDHEHFEIAKRQLAITDSLKTGATTFSEYRKRLSSLESESRYSTAKVAFIVLAVLGIPVGAMMWVNGGLDKKADKSVESKLEKKADKSDVSELSSKFDRFATTVLQSLEKLSTKGK